MRQLRRRLRKELDAQRTSWWQPGKRDQLNAEAAALREVAVTASKQAVELASHADEIQRQLGGPRVWQQARDLADRAEAVYERAREQAIADDRRGLTRLERAVETHEAKALDAASRHTELTAERDLRDTMPQPQHALENQLRTEHQQSNRVADLQQRMAALKHNLALDPDQEIAQMQTQHEAEQERRLGYERATPAHEMHQQIHDRDIDGPGLGL